MNISPVINNFFVFLLALVVCLVSMIYERYWFFLLILAGILVQVFFQGIG